jgi:hypothetical protein
MNLELLIAEIICQSACWGYAERSHVEAKLQVRGLRLLAIEAGLPKSFQDEIWAWERLILEEPLRAAKAASTVRKLLRENGYACTT